MTGKTTAFTEKLTLHSDSFVIINMELLQSSELHTHTASNGDTVRLGADNKFVVCFELIHIGDFHCLVDAENDLLRDLGGRDGHISKRLDVRLGILQEQSGLELG